MESWNGYFVGGPWGIPPVASILDPDLLHPSCQPDTLSQRLQIKGLPSMLKYYLLAFFSTGVFVVKQIYSGCGSSHLQTQYSGDRVQQGNFKFEASLSFIARLSHR